jgi:hypothetical protein
MHSTLMENLKHSERVCYYGSALDYQSNCGAEYIVKLTDVQCG